MKLSLVRGRGMTVAALLGAVAPSACAQIPPTTASFGGVPTVTVPLRRVHGLVAVSVMVNGRGPLTMILDTGAPIIVITDSARAAELGLQMAGRASVGGTGDGPAVSAPLARDVTARVGTLEVTGALAVIGIAGAAIPGVDGVIGGTLFRHAVVEFDWDAGVVRFHDPSTKTHFATGDTLRLRVESSLHSFVSAPITINGAARTVDLHLDTGARQPLNLAPSTIARFGVRPTDSVPMIVAFGSRGAAHGYYVRTDLLQLGSARVASIPTAVPGDNAANAGVIGIPVLERFHFYVDFPGQRLILSPRAGVTRPFAFNTTGIVFAPAPDSSPRVIADVIPGSPAATAGILVGDSVIAVGGRNLSTLAPDELDRLLVAAPPGTSLDVVTRRGSSEIARRLTTRVLLR